MTHSVKERDIENSVEMQQVHLRLVMLEER